jgi:hypothetical protein
MIKLIAGMCTSTWYKMMPYGKKAYSQDKQINLMNQNIVQALTLICAVGLINSLKSVFFLLET